jgi:hypothetical protein
MTERSVRGWVPPWSRRGHLSEATLVEVRERRRAGDCRPTDPHEAHLDVCDRCTTALEHIDHDVTRLVHRAGVAADAAISPERLSKQFDVIARRIDGHSGRVLPFPAPARAVRPARPLHRWVAMAAACGLLFGLAAGRLLGPASTLDTGRTTTTWRTTTTRAPQMPPTLEPALADERLLGEVDAAIARTLHQEFRVLDELTPRGPVARGRR